LAHNITKKLDVNDLSLVHLTLIPLLHYLVKCRSRSLAIYSNEFVNELLKLANISCRLGKALKIGYLFNIS